MSKRALIPLAPGFEEIEAITIIDVLRRAQLEVTVAALEGEEVEGAHAITVRADARLAEISSDEYDALILPGGTPGSKNLLESKRTRQLVAQFHSSDKIVAAICAAPWVLADCGLLDGKQATSHPSVEDRLLGTTYSTDPVVLDDNIITSRGVGTALAFSLKLVEILVSAEKSEELAKAMLVD